MSCGMSQALSRHGGPVLRVVLVLMFVAQVIQWPLPSGASAAATLDSTRNGKELDATTILNAAMLTMFGGGNSAMTNNSVEGDQQISTGNETRFFDELDFE
ncbi:hypothetical protein B566_EDAN002322 [Ephemera danica]|nr:hypothetical protein B566_EDAN002322 [Ephemera danica]